LLLLVLACSTADEPKPAPRLDLYGDPLPAGAVARLGTVRLRPGRMVRHLLVSTNGNRLATFSETGFSLWDPATGRELRHVALPSARVHAAVWPDANRGVALLELGHREYYLWDFADEKAARPPVLERSQLVGVQGGQDNEYHSAWAVSRDGRWLAAGRSGWQERLRNVSIWKIETGQFLRDLSAPRTLGPQEGHCSGVAFSPDGRQLLVFSKEKEAKEERLVVYELNTSGQRQQLAVPSTIQQGTIKVHDISPDGRTLALGLADGTCRLLDLSGRGMSRSIGNHVGQNPNHKGVSAVTFSPDGRTLITAGRDQVVRLWDFATGQELRTLENKSASWIETVVFAPNGDWLATAGQGGIIRVWDAATGAERSSPAGHRQMVWSVAVSPDGKSAATSGFDETLRFWNLDKGSELRQLALGKIGSVTYAPQGNGVLVGVNETLRFFDANSGNVRELPTELAKFSGWAHGFSVDGQSLITSGKGIVTLWDWPAGRPRRTIELQVPPDTSVEEIRCSAASLSPDGRVLITNSERHVQRMVDGVLHGGVRFLATELWDATTGQRLHRLENSPWYGKHAFSRDGRFFVLSGNGGLKTEALALWDVGTGALHKAFEAPKDRNLGPGRPSRSVRNFALAPNRATLATAEDDGSVLVYDIASGQLRRKLTGHRGVVLSLAFTPDGERLLTASADTTCLLWDLSDLLRAKNGVPP
jgi:WD40 repeat protein